MFSLKKELVARRTVLGYTKAEAAAAIGVVRWHYQNWEADQRNTTLAMLYRIAAGLKGHVVIGDTEPKLEDVPGLIYRQRIDLGLSQAQLQKLSSTRNRTIGQWESGAVGSAYLTKFLPVMTALKMPLNIRWEA